MSCVVHPTAIVDEKAELGVDVKIGPYSIIGPDVKIGDRSCIGPHVVIEGRTELGEQNEVFQFASLGARPQDLKYRGEPSTLVIGAHNIIREYVTIQPGTEHGHMTTKVGNNNLFMAYSHVGHDCFVGNHNVFANSSAMAGHVTVFDGVILGGLVGVHQFCRIGSMAMLSGGTMVGHDVPPYCIAQGDRAFLRGLNLIGLQRAGFSNEDISALKRAFRLMFSSRGHLHGRPDLPADLAANPRVQVMLDFIEGTSRGIMSMSRSSG